MILLLMDKLEEHDDVQNVYSNFDIPDEVMEKVGLQKYLKGAYKAPFIF